MKAQRPEITVELFIVVCRWLSPCIGQLRGLHRKNTQNLAAAVCHRCTSLTQCGSHLSVLLSQNRGNAGQELVPCSMNFWGEITGIAGSHGAQDTVGKQLKGKKKR